MVPLSVVQFVKELLNLDSAMPGQCIVIRVVPTINSWSSWQRTNMLNCKMYPVINLKLATVQSEFGRAVVGYVFVRHLNCSCLNKLGKIRRRHEIRLRCQWSIVGRRKNGLTITHDPLAGAGQTLERLAQHIDFDVLLVTHSNKIAI